MNDFYVVDTATLESKDSKYVDAIQIESRTLPNTANASSSTHTVSSSKVDGFISIRTIPSAANMTAGKKNTL